MSRGYGGFGIKESENDEFVVYAYSSFNWNDEKHYNDERICDGIITISKKAIAVCEEESLEISFVNLYNQKGIIIENCSNTWIQKKAGWILSPYTFAVESSLLTGKNIVFLKNAIM